MVEPFPARLLERDDFERLLDDQDRRAVARAVLADRTALLQGDHLTFTAVLEFVLERDECVPECLRGRLARPKQVERVPLGGLGSDARELAELVDNLLNLRRKEGDQIDN